MSDEVLTPTVNNYGLYAEHNMPCAIYWDKGQPAVFNCNTGYFHPSRLAERKGWRLVRAESWLQRTAIRYLFPENPV